jgi:hypothetical protein
MVSFRLLGIIRRTIACDASPPKLNDSTAFAALEAKDLGSCNFALSSAGLESRVLYPNASWALMAIIWILNLRHGPSPSGAAGVQTDS